jgi:hypothetical protein
MDRDGKPINDRRAQVLPAGRDRGHLLDQEPHAGEVARRAATQNTRKSPPNIDAIRCSLVLPLDPAPGEA